MRVFLALILIFLFFPPQHASAAKGTLRIAPAVTEVVLNPDETEKETEFKITNTSSDLVNLELFAVNFRQISDYGQIGFEGLGTYSFPLVSYFVLPESIIELRAGESKTIKATIQNRDDLTSGGHYVALVARLIQNDSDLGNSNFHPALSSLVLIRKTGGERFNLSLKDSNFPRSVIELFHPKKITLLYQNEGNVHLVPYGRVEIKDMLGRMIYKGVINSGSLSILPSSRRYVSVDMQKTGFVLPISLNTLEVSGRDSLDKTRFFFRETYVYINPIILVLIPFGVIVFRRRKKFIK